MSRSTRVVIADAHPPTLAGVRAALETGGLEVVAAVSDAQAAVEAVLESRPDVCLLETALPGGGLAATASIAEFAPETAVVILTATEGEDRLFASLRVGAVGYLPKDMNPDRLAAAVRDVATGSAAIPRALVTRLVREYRRVSEAAGLDLAREMGLSARQTRVLEMLGERRTTKEIAAELGLSAVTVRRHISSAVSRLGTADRDEAVAALERHRRSRN